MGHASSFMECIGNTPLVHLSKVSEMSSADIYMKLEFHNPTGSIKDRIAKEMLTEAEDQGLLYPGSKIVEPTSGNTGIALAAVAAVKGYRFIAVMPEFMSKERRTIMQAFGAEVVLTPESEQVQGALDKAEQMAREDPDVFLPHQFKNLANRMAHYKTTGPEIYDQMNGEIDFFVAAAGTGGTITGVSDYLREKLPDVKIIVVEPATSAVLSGKEAGPHKIQGIGEGFIPELLDESKFDEVMEVMDEDSYSGARMLARTEGIFGGMSTGTNIFAAIQIARANHGTKIVTLAPDSGMRYLSEDLYNLDH